MNVNIGRLKKWDWGVLIAFLVTIIGVSIPWWKAKGISEAVDALEGLSGLFGSDLGDLAGEASSAATVFGWEMGAGVTAFIFGLFVVLWVAAKTLLPADRPLPKWYMQAWPVLVFGAVAVICGLVGTFHAPFGGWDVYGWRPGGLITLVAAVGVLYCGYMMLKDKSGDYGQSPMPNINVSTGSSTPPSDTPPSDTPPTA